MKFTIKLSIFLVICAVGLIDLASAVKVRQAPPANQLEASWERLFTDPHRTSYTCENKKKEKPREKEVLMPPQEESAGPVRMSMPKKKVNTYAMKMIGWGPSAYLFDYLDSVLEKSMVSSFKSIFEMAKAIKADPDVNDPYSLESMTGAKGEKEELLIKLRAMTKSGDDAFFLDLKIWDNSITVPQIAKIMSEWNWFHDRRVTNDAKNLVDRFDFNGDGRLSVKEFTIAMIKVNKMIAPEGQCKNCLAEIILSTIDPIFMYLDCGMEDKINSENLWGGLQKLKRDQPNDYNFYRCDYQGGSFRTSTVNDFMIKARKTIDGYITKPEFRMAILEGYWARHVDEMTVVDNCTLNMKCIRWGEDGKIDKTCENLKKQQEKN